MVTSGRVELLALPDFPLVKAGDDLAALVARSIAGLRTQLQNNDIVVVAQKIVSKAEDRYVDLTTVEPSAEAVEVARTCLKDPRLVHLVLGQSRRIVRCAPNVLIVEHQLGLIMANAGIDQSNVGELGQERVLLLPQDPDASAERLCLTLSQKSGAAIAVVINDSFGRPWRQGSVGVAIGAAGFAALDDRRGQPDIFGRRLEVTVVGLADEVAAAASLVMGQGAERQPVVLVRGLALRAPARPAADLVRPSAEDLFR